MTRENMFGINLDDESLIDHEELILRRESAALTAKREELGNEFSDALKKTIKKTIWRILPPYIVVAVGMLLASLSFSLYDNKGTFSLPLTVAAAALVLAGMIWIIINRKKDKTEDSVSDELLDSTDDAYEAFNAQVKEELCIPTEAVEVEIFANMHSAHREKRKRFAYSCDLAEAFIEDGKLCFWYGGGVIGFSMSEIESLVKVNAPITFDSWLADDPHDSLKYAKYDISVKEIDYEDIYTMMGYYSLRFTHEGAPFELLFPLYNAESLLKLLDCEMVEE